MNRATRRKLRYYEHIYPEVRIARVIEKRRRQLYGMAYKIWLAKKARDIITLDL